MTEDEKKTGKLFYVFEFFCVLVGFSLHFPSRKFTFSDGIQDLLWFLLLLLMNKQKEPWSFIYEPPRHHHRELKAGWPCKVPEVVQYRVLKIPTWLDTLYLGMVGGDGSGFQ